MNGTTSCHSHVGMACHEWYDKMAFDSYFYFFLFNIRTYADKKDTDNSGRNNGVWRDKGEDEKGMG